MKGCEMTGTWQPIRDALFTSLALWWLVLKKLPGTQCFAKGCKQIFCKQSLFYEVKKDHYCVGIVA